MSVAWDTFMGSSNYKGLFHSHIEYHESLHDQTDLHSTKLCSLFSCHFHWLEGHSASSVKWLRLFNGLKRTKLSMLHCTGLNQNRDEAKGKREGSTLRERKRERERCHTGLHLLKRFAVESNYKWTKEEFLCSRIKFSICFKP